MSEEEPGTDLELGERALVAMTAAERGLLLHSSAGYDGVGLLPRPVRRWATIFSSAPPAVLSALALILAGGATPAGVLAAIGLGAASWFGARWLIPHQLRLFARLRSRKDAPDAVPSGAIVRVRGRVRARNTFPSAVSGRPAVLARYEIRGERAAPQHRIRGVDFEVETENGVAVAVPAEDVFLDAPMAEPTTIPRDLSVLGRPAAQHGASPYGRGLALPGEPIHRHLVVYREALLSANDEVEVSGIIVREVDPAGSGDGASRSAPMRLAVRAGHSMPVFVRKL
jgi:hypothetical protein